MQVFTKTPNRWRDPALPDDAARQFRQQVDEYRINAVVSHDSYLINLASPDPELRQRSIASFEKELDRSYRLGVQYVVTHPGNFKDGRREGIERNAAAYSQCLERVPGPGILIETTAGTGTALGSRFEELRQLRDLVTPRLRSRVQFCADTCHLYSAGYDLVGDFDGVWEEWDEILGLESLRCLHLNDSKTPFQSRRDRHACIGEGSLGIEPFRRIMTDRRFADVIKIIETPKGDDPVASDRAALDLLRGLAPVADN